LRGIGRSIPVFVCVFHGCGLKSGAPRAVTICYPIESSQPRHWSGAVVPVTSMQSRGFVAYDWNSRFCGLPVVCPALVRRHGCLGPRASPTARSFKEMLTMARGHPLTVPGVVTIHETIELVAPAAPAAPPPTVRVALEKGVLDCSMTCGTTSRPTSGTTSVLRILRRCERALGCGCAVARASVAPRAR